MQNRTKKRSGSKTFLNERRALRKRPGLFFLKRFVPEEMRYRRKLP
jgi:hypothetical protein